MLDLEGTFQVKLKAQPSSMRCKAIAAGRLMATTSVSFDGESASTRLASRHIRVQHMTYRDGNLDVSLKVSGWGFDGGLGDGITLSFEIFDAEYRVALDTSCGAPMQLPSTYPAAPDGAFTLEKGSGDCVDKMPTTTGVETVTWGGIKVLYN